jgi:hypothetical protein
MSQICIFVLKVDGTVTAEEFFGHFTATVGPRA